MVPIYKYAQASIFLHRISISLEKVMASFMADKRQPNRPLGKSAISGVLKNGKIVLPEAVSIS